MYRMNNKKTTLIIVALVIVGVGIVLWTQTPRESATQESLVPESNQQIQTSMQEQTNIIMQTLPSGLQIGDIAVGTGDEAKAGNMVTVHYTGTLIDGTKFDSSLDRGTPFTFSLGVGQVIRGWDEGVSGMKVGGKRRLTIPPDLGYGSQGAGNVIPPNATLVFEVELLGVK